MSFKTNMIRLKINKVKAFVPLSISKGTTEQRMQKARISNLAFYDKLQDCIRNNEIAPRTFVSKLKSTVGAKLGIEIAESKSKEDSYMAYCFNEKATNIGYTIALPLNYYKKNIHKNYAQVFLKHTQNLLNEAFNSKILARFATLVNKGYDVKSILKFYHNNVASKATLTPEDLSDFLKDKSNMEKINTLQFMRYKLMSEKNTEEASYQIDRRIEKHNCFRFQLPSNHYSLEPYQYDEKFKLLDEKLLETINAERG